MKSPEKYEVWLKLAHYVQEFKQVLVVDFNEVSSNLVQDVRDQLYGKAVMLFSKNTIIRAGLTWRMKRPTRKDFDYEQRQATWFPMPELAALHDLCKQKVCLVFCISPMEEVWSIIDSVDEEVAFREGFRAQWDVYVEAGTTPYSISALKS
jgi:large subunit ribosomal protein LP0